MSVGDSVRTPSDLGSLVTNIQVRNNGLKLSLHESKKLLGGGHRY